LKKKLKIFYKIFGKVEYSSYVSFVIRVKHKTNKNMNDLQLKSLITGLTLVEYVDFVESRALHLGVDAEELNIEFWEKNLISMVKFDLAKAELHRRDFMFAHYGEY
jgi:hypothetical protein